LSRQSEPEKMLMDVEATSLGEVPLLEIRGDIDHGTCATVENALNDILAKGNRIVLLDLSGVTYVDSGGISVLLAAGRQLRPKGWLGLIGPNHDVRRLLEIVGLFVDPSFRGFDDRTAAEASLAATPVR
jgi:anti-sigma B factor antagonist